MWWESLIFMVVFVALVLILGPEWWSSSLGTLKEKKGTQEKPSSGKPGPDTSGPEKPKE